MKESCGAFAFFSAVLTLTEGSETVMMLREVDTFGWERAFFAPGRRPEFSRKRPSLKSLAALRQSSRTAWPTASEVPWGAVGNVRELFFAGETGIACVAG